MSFESFALLKVPTERIYSSMKMLTNKENMNKTENVELTVLCLITAGDKVLLQNRVKNDWKGYTLPGGQVGKNVC